MTTARRLPRQAKIIGTYQLEAARQARGAYARTAAKFVHEGYRCSDQHVINVVKRREQEQHDVAYEPAPGELEARAAHTASANEALLLRLVLADPLPIMPIHMPTTSQREPSREGEIMSSCVQLALPTALVLPTTSRPFDYAAECKIVADWALVSGLFAVAVVFVAGLKDWRLALALATPLLWPLPWPCYGWLHYVVEAQRAYGAMASR